jgi:hypothetical protein
MQSTSTKAAVSCSANPSSMLMPRRFFVEAVVFALQLGQPRLQLLCLLRAGSRGLGQVQLSLRRDFLFASAQLLGDMPPLLQRVAVTIGQRLFAELQVALPPMQVVQLGLELMHRGFMDRAGGGHFGLLAGQLIGALLISGALPGEPG